jgi:urease accessory protein
MIADVRATAEIGRRARLELRFTLRDGKTVLADAYAEPPLRVGRTFREGDGLHMIMASSAPGIFGGDTLEQTIHVERGARVRLTSQSALQIHPSARGSVATIRSRYRIDEGAELSCFWDPLIPFADSRFEQRIELEASGEARLSWSDAFMAGREARGERWAFDELSHELRLIRDGRLDYLERFRIEPERTHLANRWLASGACYFGSVLAASHSMGREEADLLHGRLAECDGVDAAADLIAPDLQLVRLMSASGPAFHKARWSCHRCSAALQGCTHGPDGLRYTRR